MHVYIESYITLITEISEVSDVNLFNWFLEWPSFPRYRMIARLISITAIVAPPAVYGDYWLRHNPIIFLERERFTRKTRGE